MKSLTIWTAMTLGVWICAGPASLGFQFASSCSECHGGFKGPVSPKGTVFPSNNKHEMHRANNSMNTDCMLCHTEIGDDPRLDSSGGTENNPGLGCAGCHVGAGLRAHHAASGVMDCYTAECHDPEPSAPENVKPPYYGTADTRVDNPCNDVLASTVNENWSIGDFVGLDNDGNNLYDQADFACGPPYQIVDIVVEGKNVRVTWDTVGGRTDVLRAAQTVAGAYTNVGPAIPIPGVGPVRTNRLEVGGADSSALRAYRLRYAEPE